jgi:hypothetical protein
LREVLLQCKPVQEHHRLVRLVVLRLLVVGLLLRQRAARSLWAAALELRRQVAFFCFPALTLAQAVWVVTFKSPVVLHRRDHPAVFRLHLALQLVMQPALLLLQLGVVLLVLVVKFPSRRVRARLRLVVQFLSRAAPERRPIVAQSQSRRLMLAQAAWVVTLRWQLARLTAAFRAVYQSLAVLLAPTRAEAWVSQQALVQVQLVVLLAWLAAVLLQPTELAAQSVSPVAAAAAEPEAKVVTSMFLAVTVPLRLVAASRCVRELARHLAVVPFLSQALTQVLRE